MTCPPWCVGCEPGDEDAEHWSRPKHWRTDKSVLSVVQFQAHDVAVPTLRLTAGDGDQSVSIDLPDGCRQVWATLGDLLRGQT